MVLRGVPRQVLGLVLLALPASALPPPVHFHLDSLQVEVDGGFEDLGMPIEAIPDPALVFVTAVLDSNARLQVLNGTIEWVVLTGEAGGARTPVSYFDLNQGMPRTFTARLSAISPGARAVARQVDITFVPLATAGVPFNEAVSPAAYTNNAAWQSPVSVTAVQTGPHLVLGGCAASQAMPMVGVGVRLTTPGNVFPEGHDGGDQSWFFTEQATPQGGFVAAVVDLTAGDRVKLEVKVNPRPDAATGPNGVATCEETRVMTVPLTPPFVAWKYTPRLGNVTANKVTSELTVPTVPGLVYVALQQAYAHRDTTDVLASFGADGKVLGGVQWSTPGSATNRPLSNVGVFVADGGAASVSMAVQGAGDTWGATTVVLGPYGEAIELTTTRDGGFASEPDAGAADAGLVDAGKPDRDGGIKVDGGVPADPPQILSSPPADAFCHREWRYEPEILSTSQVVVSLRRAPEGVRLDGRAVLWVPTRDQVGPHQIELVVGNKAGESVQEIALEVPECTLDFGTRPCGCSAGEGAFAVLALALLGLRWKRAPGPPRP